MSKDDCIRLRKLREQVEQARNFPENTCPASRHLYMMADYLSKGEPYQMLADEPLHCAETMLAVLGSLWKARTELAKLNAVAQAPNAQQAEPPAWNALVSDREYLRLFDEARHGSTGGFGVLRGIRACIAAYEAATPAQQAELPPGWKTVVVPEDVGPEPDWEGVRYQAETATGINLPRAVFSIVIREVRRWLAAQQAEAQEPVATINISDDDFDLGLTDDYAFGIKRLPNGEHQLFTRPQPAQLQALSEFEEGTLVIQHMGPAALARESMTLMEAFDKGVKAGQSALAAKNWAVLK